MFLYIVLYRKCSSLSKLHSILLFNDPSRISEILSTSPLHIVLFTVNKRYGAKVSSCMYVLVHVHVSVYVNLNWWMYTLFHYNDKHTCMYLKMILHIYHFIFTLLTMQQSPPPWELCILLLWKFKFWKFWYTGVCLWQLNISRKIVLTWALWRIKGSCQ